MSPLAEPPTRNWARTVRFAPRHFARPADEAQLAALVRQVATRSGSLRVVGAGHSFSPVAQTDDTLVSIDRLAGLIRADRSSGLVTVGAGTRLRDLPALLQPLGLALENMGDVDPQSIAGAISTGTHGTGLRFGGLATQVRALRLVLADGTPVDCSATQNAPLFQAARLGLGTIGVLTEVTLQCVPHYLLQADEHPEPLAAVLEQFQQRCAAADHFELYWFPHTARALVKSNTRMPAGTPRAALSATRRFIDNEAINNGLYELTCRLGARVPALIPPINRLATRMVAHRTFTDSWHQVFVSPRRVRFAESEFAVPIDALAEVVRRIDELIRSRGWRISFPLEIRCAAADDIWLSTAYQRTSAYVAVHRYAREPHHDYFAAIQQIMTEYDGRAHWGKIHSLEPDYLRRVYPRFDEFRAVRREADPGGVFLNDHLRMLFA